MKKEKNDIKGLVGKKVRVITEKKELEGVLLESYDPNIVLVKLSSGYNIGLERSKIKEVHQIKGKEKEKEGKEEKQEVKEIKLKKGLPEVVFIVTGGTISSRVDYKTGAVHPLTNPEDIIMVAPKIREMAKPVIKSPFMVFTENMTSKHWKKLAKVVEKALSKKKVKGVVVLCGTDILHYISAALSFMIKKPGKPVVLTYSQRSIDRGSTDALLNLTCSTYAALSDIAEIMVVGHASTHDNACFCLKGTKVRKMHTSRRDTFRPINTRPIATIYEDGKMERWQDYKKRQEAKEKIEAETGFEDKTALVKWFPNSSPKILDFFIKKKYCGVVIEAGGLGHVSVDGKTSWLNKIKEAVKKDMVVCFAPQTLYGALDPLVYSTGRRLKEAGVVYLGDMLPETAYIKLGWLLGHEKSIDKVKQMMQENLVGELNPRLSMGDFLV